MHKQNNNNNQTNSIIISGLKNAMAAGLFVLVMSAICIYLSQHTRSIWPDYNTMQSLASPWQWLRWILGDMSEAQFYKSELASLGLILGACLAYYATRQQKKWQGFEISYATGLFPWILLSSSLSLVLSNMMWGWTLITSQHWQPTFVTFVSLPAAIVLMYGRGFKVAVIAAVFGAVLITPLSLLIVNSICNPFSLPSVLGNVSGMGIGSLLAFYLLHRLPILSKPSAISDLEQTEHNSENIKSTQSNDDTLYGPLWTIRRMLADFSESQFFANEWASIGYLLGVFLAIYLNPLSIAYGSGLIAKILISQLIASALAVVIWNRQWKINGWYPTYIAISSVAPACVLVFQGSVLSIILGATIGAIVAPPLAHSISKKLAHYQHPYIGNVFSMAITTLIALGLIHLIA